MGGGGLLVQSLIDRLISSWSVFECTALYRKELWATSRIGRYTIESDLMSTTLTDLQQKIQQMQEYGERLASEKQQMEVSDHLIKVEVRSAFYPIGHVCASPVNASLRPAEAVANIAVIVLWQKCVQRSVNAV